MQGIVCEVVEQGLFEDHLLKCKERMCGRAQLETMMINYDITNRFSFNSNNLSSWNQEKLRNMLFELKPCARCMYPDFTCNEGCIWGPNKALTRLI